MKLEDYSIIAWLQNNQMKTESGQPVDLSSHFFLYDFFTDWSENIVCRKSAQVGFSTSAIYKSIWAVSKKKLDAIYTLPSSSDAKVFVGGKVNRIANQNEVIRDLMPDKDSVEQKQIGDNMIYYRGTFSQQQAISVTADLLVLDEYDRSKQDILEMYSSRLQHSKYKWKWIFSNPSFENVGVDKFWRLSDQKHWFITCPHCQKEQYLDFPHNISFERETFICRHCGEDLPDEARRKGRWRKKYLNREWSGYWINMLMAPWIDAKYIINEHKNKSPEYFENFVMGRPYIGGDAKLLRDDFFKNLTPIVNKQEGKIVIGVDPGKPFWYTIGNENGIFYNGKDHDGEQLRYLMTNRYKDAIMVIDIGGEPLWARKMLEEFPNRVFLCQFGADRKTLQIIRWGEKEERGIVLADRNRLIQMVMDELRDERIPLCGKEDDFKEMFNHIDNVYRTVVEDKVTKMDKYVYESTKPDHLLFALLYWRVGMDRYGFGKGEILDEQSQLETQKGFIINDSLAEFF